MAAVAYRNISAMIAGKALKNFVYRDHGSLVSLSHFSTVGSLMGNLIGGRMAIEGRLAMEVSRSWSLRAGPPKHPQARVPCGAAPSA